MIVCSARARPHPRESAADRADFRAHGAHNPVRVRLPGAGLLKYRARTGRSLEPSRVTIVGDTPHDVDAAHGADAVGVGVASGHFSKDQLAEAGADYVLGSLEEELPL